MSNYKYYISQELDYPEIKSIENDKNLDFSNNIDIYKVPILAEYSYINKKMNVLLGKILTIIDASIVDSKQNKAIKDLIKKEKSYEIINILDTLIPKSIPKNSGILADSNPLPETQE